MIVGTRRQDPALAEKPLHKRGDVRTAICGYYPLRIRGSRSGPGIIAQTEKEILCFSTDSSRFIHRKDRNRVSVIDPGESEARFPPHIGKINELCWFWAETI